MKSLIRVATHAVFWLLAAVFLASFLGSKTANFWFTISFVGLLLPVAVGTSYGFNYYLFPDYLFKGHYFRFALYSFFFVILSIYLEMVIAVLTFIFMANYQFEDMIPGTTNIINLGVGLYFVVFLSGLIYLVRRWPNWRKESESSEFLIGKIQ